MAPDETACAASSLAVGLGLEAAVAGSTCSFAVVVKDKTGAQRPAGGDVVVARLIDRDSGRIAAEGHVLDNTDGSYHVSYVPTRCRDELLLRVTVNGQRLRGSPFRPRFVPGPVAGRCCTASGAGLHDGVAGRPIEFELQARDAFGNACDGGGGRFRMCAMMQTAACAEMRAGAAAVVRVEARDDGDGTYALAWSADVAGCYELTISWEHAVRRLRPRTIGLPDQPHPATH